MDALGAPVGLRIDPFSNDLRFRGPVSHGVKPETQAAKMRGIIAEHAAIRDRVAASPHEGEHKRTWRAPVLAESPTRVKDHINKWSCKKRPTDHSPKKGGGTGKKWVPWC